MHPGFVSGQSIHDNRSTVRSSTHELFVNVQARARPPHPIVDNSLRRDNVRMSRLQHIVCCFRDQSDSGAEWTGRSVTSHVQRLSSIVILVSS